MHWHGNVIIQNYKVKLWKVSGSPWLGAAWLESFVAVPVKNEFLNARLSLSIPIECTKEPFG